MKRPPDFRVQLTAAVDSIEGPEYLARAELQFWEADMLSVTLHFADQDAEVDWLVGRAQLKYGTQLLPHGDLGITRDTTHAKIDGLAICVYVRSPDGQALIYLPQGHVDTALRAIEGILARGIPLPQRIDMELARLLRRQP